MRTIIYCLKIALFVAFIGGTTGLVPILKATTAAFPHEIPDGECHKAIEIVIRERTVFLEYRIGLSAATMRDELKSWGYDSDETSDEALFETFADQFQSQLVEKVELSVDDQPIAADSMEYRPGGQHHVTIVYEFKYQLPADVRSFSLKAEDHTFPKLNGSARYALKSLGKAMVRRTNVAPILVRADPVELDKLDQGQREEVCQISALIVYSGDKN